MTLYNYESREDWLADRPNYVGASEVASVLNIPGAYASRWKLWMRKTGRMPPVEETEEMEWGTRLERVIAEAVEEKHGGKVSLAPGTVGPADRPVHRATLDALWFLDDETLVLEIKNVGEYLRDEWTGDAPPAALYVQVQWQLYCANLQRGAIAALIGGNRLVVHHVERNDEEIAAMKASVDVFWERVKLDIEPSMSAKDLPAYQYRWQERRGEVARVPANLVMEYAHKARAAKDAEEQRDWSRHAIQRHMGEATEGVVDGVTAFTWRTNKNGSRVFRVSKDGEQLLERLVAKEGEA